MEEENINTNESLNNNELQESQSKNKEDTSNEVEETAIIEYKEIEEPCVALTIIGENKLSVTASLVKHGVKFSLKAFFSTLLLTIAKMFI